jgi:hypothetical protein
MPYLSRKGLSTKDISLHIVHALGPDAVGYFIIVLDRRDWHCAGPMD